MIRTFWRKSASVLHLTERMGSTLWSLGAPWAGFLGVPTAPVQLVLRDQGIRLLLDLLPPDRGPLLLVKLPQESTADQAHVDLGIQE